MTRYRTIVADPPWPHDRFNNFADRHTDRPRSPAGLPYEPMSVDAIAALPVREMADPDFCHVYLWTTARYLRDAFTVLRAWTFPYQTTLTWIKSPMGAGMGGFYHPSTEFVLFGTCGGPPVPGAYRHRSTWFEGKRPYNSEGKPMHSAKPDSFLDIVEQVSPEPRLEMFARRARFGWDYWGDQSLGTAEMPGAAA